MKTFATLAAAALAIGTAGLSPAPAAAETSGGPPIVVRHADLDLATREGRAALQLRLLHAARTACGTPSPADPYGRASRNACVTATQDAAAAQIESAIALARRQAPPVLAGGR